MEEDSQASDVSKLKAEIATLEQVPEAVRGDVTFKGVPWAERHAQLKEELARALAVARASTPLETQRAQVARRRRQLESKAKRTAEARVAAHKELTRLREAVAVQEKAAARADDDDAAAQKDLRSVVAEEAAVALKVAAVPGIDGTPAPALAAALPPEAILRSEAEALVAPLLEELNRLRALYAAAPAEGSVEGSAGGAGSAEQADATRSAAASVASEAPDLNDVNWEDESSWTTVVKRHKRAIQAAVARDAAARRAVAVGAKTGVKGSLFAKQRCPIVAKAASVHVLKESADKKATVASPALRDYGPELAAQLRVSSAA